MVNFINDFGHLILAAMVGVTFVISVAIGFRYTGLVHIKGPGGSEVVIDGRGIKPPTR